VRWRASTPYPFLRGGGLPTERKFFYTCTFTQIWPLEPTRTFPLSISPLQRSLGGLANRAGYIIADQSAWMLIRGRTNRWRKSALGLPPLRRRHAAGPYASARRRCLPVLCGFSPNVVPRPLDWGPHIHVTGYRVSEQPDGWAPPKELVEFLDAGPPPVSVGFGSWQPPGTEVHSLAACALRLAGLRGSLAAGSDGVGDPYRYGSDMFVVGEVAHEWLFPRMAAVVHHGGAGTTGAALRAGVPNVVVPFVGDQPYWGPRVAALGAGPRPMAIKRLRPEPLADLLRATLANPEIATRAARLGALLRGERGVETACDVIEKWLTDPDNPTAAGGGIP
jgi:sterol 3beta-glucosyltransferase